MKTRCQLILLSTLLAVAPWAHAGVKAKVLLADQQEPWVIEFTGRGTTEWIRLTKLDNDVDMRFPPSAFRKVEFAINLKDAQLEERYLNEKYDEIVAILAPQIMPAADYLDLPNNNLIPLFQVLMHSQFWRGNYPEAGRMASLLLEKLKEGDPVYRESRIILGLAVLKTDRADDARKILSDIPVGGKTEPEDAWYWYAMGQLHLQDGQLDEAQEAFARVIGFHTKSFEWMSAGLYAAAEGYMAARGYDSARKVINNIRIAYPGTQWGRRLPALYEQLEKDEAAWKIEVARREAEAKRQAELAVLPFRERIKKDPALRKPPQEKPSAFSP